MPTSRARATAVALGLAALLAVGAATPASASTASSSDGAGLSTASSASARDGVRGRSPIAGKPAKTVIALSVKAATKASSVHVSVRGTDDKSRWVGELVIGRTSGRATISDSKDGRWSLIRIGKKVWFTADATYWKADGADDADQVAKVLAGKWILLDPKTKFYKFNLSLLTVKHWLDYQLNVRSLRFVPSPTIRKMPTVAITDGASLLLVQAKGQPLPIAIADLHSPVDNITAFTAWNKRIRVVAPKNAITEDQVPLVLAVP
jgi:hypothetical protein